MTKEFSPELKLKLAEIRSNMAVDGFDLPEAQLLEIGEHLLSSDLPEKLEFAKEIAERERRPYMEVLNEILGEEFVPDPELEEEDEE